MGLEEYNSASLDATVAQRKVYEAPALVELDVEDTEGAAGIGLDNVVFS